MRWPHVTEFPVVGWNAIWKQLFHVLDKHGNHVPLMSLYALRQYRREELMAAGAVFRIHVGPLRHVRYCAWPSKVREWLFDEPLSLSLEAPPEEQTAIRGWEAIWKFLFHMNNGERLIPMFSLRTLQDKHARSLKGCGCVFQFKRNVLAWPVSTRAWIQVMAEKGQL